MTTPLHSPENEYLTLAAQALRTSGGTAALDALGWWDLLRELHAADLRTAAFAVFRAQGRELASSPALGGLLAQPYLDGTTVAPGTVIATVLRPSPRRDPMHVVVGDVHGRQLLVDRPGEGAAIIDVDAVDLRSIDVPGKLVLHEIDADWSRAAVTIEEPRARTARERSACLGRIALALEILGAAEAAVALAIDHAENREQFSQPIGRFQAVRHLLAWARTDCIAIESVARQAVALHTAVPPRYADVLKALAGRNGRRACERALQVLGGIGFTAEHDHHHHHSRVLALDALLGTSSELIHDLAAWLRSEGTNPRFASAVLMPDMP
jgi:hypothetical protein